jgi:hypothetical protein
LGSGKLHATRQHAGAGCHRRGLGPIRPRLNPNPAELTTEDTESTGGK